MDLRRALASVVLFTSVAARAQMPPVMPGWDACKWNDPNHQTPKYVVGRIIAHYPHTPNGLKAASVEIAKVFPGAKYIDEPRGGDTIHIPCVGLLDLVVAADGPDVGTAWAWQVVEDECKKCSDGKDHCDGSQVSKSKVCVADMGGPPAVTDDEPALPAPCTPPSGEAVAKQVLQKPGMKDAIKRLCRKGTDWTYLDAVVDQLNLKEKTPRWGYWCRRGDCNDPSHDVLAYLCAKPGKESPEGSPNAAGVDFIAASCYDPKDSTGVNPTIVWQKPFGNGGKSAWTSHGRW